YRGWTMVATLAAAWLVAAGCGEGASGPHANTLVVPEAEPAPDPSDPNEPPQEGCGEAFESTFGAIQQVIFEDRGCTEAVCHGSSAQGGLDLRPDVAYQNLFQAASQGSALPRLTPGEPTQSYLFRKLQAGVEPGRVEIAGAPMPSGLPPISEGQLEALRLWIEVGAPETGSTGDSVRGSSDYIEGLLEVCLPPATPVEIAPLPAPDPEVGVQFAMPTFTLPAATEVEVCFAQYFDFSEIVPETFQDPEAGVFYVNGSRLRQDPHSHHLILHHSGLGADFVDHEAFGAWACRGGSRDGETCDPLDPAFCGESLCGSEVRDSLACIGYGPPDAAINPAGGGFGGAQTAQQFNPPRDGQFEALPIRGILLWNAHAFNLTTKDHEMHAWQNFFFTDDLRFEELRIVRGGNDFAGQPPFTYETYCTEHVMPEGAELLFLSSHTHKRGRNFTADLPDGTRIYESAFYSDPVEQEFDPPLRFDSPNPADRTIHYCADYNNGVDDDGAPDLRYVTRLSTMPNRATCTPVACVEGRIGSACAGEGDDEECDSSPGAGDGWCDACAITPGVTTENEMFFLLGSYTVRE
ncbi:MAG: hypothetical protein P8R42_19145, partial [Candidatus Binatia bacterium]|nr:hypothetical protein [Candidatus Binatia bacterium]